MLEFDLIIPPIVAGLVILAIHAYLGLHVIARGVIFVDLAFAQIAALGTTVGILLGIGHGPGELLFALAFTLLGALIFSFTRMEDSAVPQEAIIGITFVVASAAVILIAGLTAEGAEHIRETMTGTLIWVDWPTIGKMAGAYAVVGAFHFVFRRRFLSLTFAPEGVDGRKLWDFLFYVSFGVVIAFSVNVAGVLMVFSALVIPGVVAFEGCSRAISLPRCASRGEPAPSPLWAGSAHPSTGIWRPDPCSCVPSGSSSSSRGWCGWCSGFGRMRRSWFGGWGTSI